MSEWYVYEESGAHRGPMTTGTLARAIRAKEVAADAWVASDPWFEAPGTSGWQKANEVAEIMQVIGQLSASELRVVAGGFTSTWQGTPEFGASVMIAPRPKR